MAWTARADLDRLGEIYLRTILKSEYLNSKILGTLIPPVDTLPEVLPLCFSGTYYVSLN